MDPIPAPPAVAPRADPYGTQRLEQHAIALAATHRVLPGKHPGRPLLARLKSNRRAIDRTSRDLAALAAAGGSLTPAAEWLIDNYHLVGEQLVDVERDLSPGFYLELPKLADGDRVGLPRVLALVQSYLEQAHSRFDLDTLRRFVVAYQTVQPLTLGELWAIAISLRLVLVEILRRLADAMAERRAQQDGADALADALLDRRHLCWVSWRLRRLATKELSGAFATRMLQRLNDRDPESARGRAWLEDQLAQQVTTPDEVVRGDHLRQVSGYGPVRDGITSMRAISGVAWADFVEEVSLVELALRDGGPPHELDFATRDQYRHEVEDLARYSNTTELRVAREVARRARRARNAGVDPSRASNAGYHLISDGREALEADLGYRPHGWQRVARALPFGPTTGYLGAVLVGTALASGVPLAFAARAGAPGPELLGLALLAVIPASELASALVNRFAMWLIGPRRLPKLALEDGVPAELRTLVVIPSMLTNEVEVGELLERLGVHYLANDDPELRFALATDWSDAETERAPIDGVLLAQARAGIDALNASHAKPEDPIFFLFHRARRWNPRQARWMGWERKRGKLHELNRLLRGAVDTSFLCTESDCATLAALGFRYVITLDSDTRLGRGAARRLVGTIAHPLNRAEIDRATGLVVTGYGILQPRITPMLPESGEGTLNQRLFSGPAGLDPYAFASSDVYQDLFGEGSYTGKGIYDLDAFERALAGRVPENTVLSHDLFEGVHARAGLVADIELFEYYPARYSAAVARQHRWTRGDWQLLPWILAPGPLDLVARFKMLDNLRRSLVAPATLATLLVAWILPGSRALVWTAFVVATVAVPAMLPAILDLLPRRSRVSSSSFVRDQGGDLALAVGRVALGLALVVGNARQMGDAIGRTLYRLSTRRGPMLEWVTASEAIRVDERRASEAGAVPWTAMGGPSRNQLISLAAAGLGVVGTFLLAPRSLPLAAPFLLLWGLAPLILRWISTPRPIGATKRVDPIRSQRLRLTARRSWQYFEAFVTPADNHLPPDNMQEEPRETVAHRTSPTNIGLYLLSAMTAHEMGWLSTGALVARLELTFSALDRLEKHRGHLFNWYDTVTLAPLAPRYVSTVDSGNLAAYLVALQQGLQEAAAREPTVERRAAGVGDALAILCEAIRPIAHDRREGPVRNRHLQDTAAALAALLESAPSRPDPWGALEREADDLVDTARALAQEHGGADYAEVQAWAKRVQEGIRGHLRDRGGNADVSARLARLAERAEGLSAGMEWGFLFDEKKRLFSTGVDAGTGRRDPFAYDLLASECRVASFMAVARGEIAPSHWFCLGRRSTPTSRGSALMSWSGSMFEYLLPSLVMAEPDGSLLATTGAAVVGSQIRYGKARGVPWGISECAYNARDLHLTYQYGIFGLPDLGFKRGLAEDLVISPYSTALAAMVDPMAAADNLVALAAVGGLGRFGFYESIDYTAARLPEGVERAVVRAYFAHHQGMSIVGLCNAVCAFPSRRWFHAAPIVKATELLLHERSPRQGPVVRPLIDQERTQLHVKHPVAPVLRKFDSPHDLLPATQRLSNGRYSVAVTAAGSGQSLWEGLAVTRWREDETLDNFGSFFFVRDVQSGAVWSAGHQPTCVAAERYEASFYEHCIAIRRRDGSVETQLDVTVATEDDAEVRQITLVNHGRATRIFDVTSYAEIVLAPDASDLAHPAFSNLFVETSYDPPSEALLATRRPRSALDVRLWAAHVSAVHGVPDEGLQFETDRARFIGRGRAIGTAVAVHGGRPLSNTVGAVVDPVFSLRRRVTVPPGETARVTYTTLVGTDRERLVARCDSYREAGVFDRTLGQAWTHSEVQRRHLNIDPEEAQLYQRLGSRLLFAEPGMRASPAVLERNQLGQSALWRFGISGDRPILLARIEEGDDGELVRQLVRAHCYWRVKGMAIDLVVLGEQLHTYGLDPHGDLERLVSSSHIAGLRNGVHVVRGEHLAESERDLLLTSARVVVQSRDGPLADQVIRRLRESTAVAPARATAPRASPEVVAPRPELEFFNGLGGFADAGRQYVVVLGAGQWTPLPWVNVIANPNFGFLVSEAGSGFTWAENSRENQLTPWFNDPVEDPPGEVLYVRDDVTGETWTPTPLPVREATPYVVHHGQGFTRFAHESHGIALELTQFVAPDDPVKFSCLRISNITDRERHLTVAAYVEWVLGSSRVTSLPLVVTSIDRVTGALFARNRWKADFADRVAFLDFPGRDSVSCGDRTRWIGRNGTVAAPAGLAGGSTGAGRVGGGLDPCGVLLTAVHLAPGETTTLVVLLGQEANEGLARALVSRARAMDPEAVLDAVEKGWDRILGIVQVTTPDRTMDLLINRWLLYQTLSCRFWARSAFYQSGGAYGFRDQLQDGMALAVTRPDLVREHLLRAAARQFPEGDVQHWWHPPSGKGVRTRFSDDRVWLAFATSHYLLVTSDTAVLDEVVPFADAVTLLADQVESYQEPGVSQHSGTLYEHAARALDVSLRVGRHGLPLIGTGDWNDGMNRVGDGGAGESVWLAWFLIATLDQWVPLAAGRGDEERAAAWSAHSQALRVAVEAEAWDGDWYRRAFQDDGTPLGSATNVEGRIDSIAQSWAVLSGAADAGRAARAMEALDELLVRRADALVLLLTPPFDLTCQDPGYIKGYLPGVRENGGQYTHAALWAVMAFAALGDGNRAYELFCMLNPIRHADTRAAMQRYKVEPYVVAADVHSAGAQVGRGGWTWYTGSAGWMYRAGLESILGVYVRRDHLHLAPCIPEHWPGFEVTIARGASRYRIVAINPNGVQRGVVALELDGSPLDPLAAKVPWVDDGRIHHVLVTLG